MGSGSSKSKAKAVKSTVQAVQALNSAPAATSSAGTSQTGSASAQPEEVKSPPPKVVTVCEEKEEDVSWRDVLTAVADMELWEGTRRENRELWRKYIQDAEVLIRKPRKPLPQDVVSRILQGDLGELDASNVSTIRRKVIVFVSSTFTDTKAERNMLMKDVYPYLRKVCRTLGMDFGSVDMRWGVNEEMTFEHGTAEACIREVKRCTRESAGPAFLCILSHKYGYRPFPPEIEQSEFEKLLNSLKEDGEDVATLQEYFRLDTNSAPPSYVLKPRTADQKDWWDVFEVLQTQLRLSASKCLTEEEAKRYYISVTEQEVAAGIFDNESKDSQVTLVERTLEKIRAEKNLHRHVIDMNKDVIDEDAQKFMEDLKEVKVINALEGTNILNFDYEERDEASVKRYVVQTCDAVCENLVRKILDTYEHHLHVEENPIFNEVMQHRSLAINKCRLFVGREEYIQAITSYVLSSNKKILAIHGTSGCGKTALMAKCAEKTFQEHSNCALVVRFLGTSSSSGSARAVLQSICHQIRRVYGESVSQIPNSYKELVPYFQQCLQLANSNKPLVLFLDSLDQLSNEDFGKNLKWLSLSNELPPNVHVVVSTLPGSCLDVLQSFLPEENIREVKPMGKDDGGAILDQMLAAEGRTVTPEQRSLVLSAFEQCPLPLYLRLAADIALKWHSYDTVGDDEIASDMPGLITTLFERLESKYGAAFVKHALGYITAAKSGLSVAELEDILSCDDDVLDEIFSFWVPPFRRIPPLLWIRVRNDLGMYLVERGVDGATVYGWYHRQFWETAENRYLQGFEDQARVSIADYFEGKWQDGKPYKPPANSRHHKNKSERVEDRQVPSQPIVVTGNREVGRKLNSRKLRELSYQLLKLQDWTRFEANTMSLEYIEAKFEVEQGFECLGEFIQASQESSKKTIKAFAKFIGANLSHLIRNPDSVYQLASQQVQGNPVKNLFYSFQKSLLPMGIVQDQSPATVEDPCEMTMVGHTNGVRCCMYSPTENIIASCAEDGSLRIWDAFSGAEMVTVTDLPGPKFSGLADPYHGERPVCFSRDGKLVATGSEDGWLQIWDLSGAQVFGEQVHQAGLTGLSFSPDNSTLATSSKDKTVKFWNTDGFSLRGQTGLSGQGLCCDYSPDGSRLAVSLYGGGAGLAMIDPNTYSTMWQEGGFCNINICCAYSPRGDQVATGGDDSSVTLWNPTKGRTGRLVSHKGWIWGLAYTKNASKLISCSSDRTLKVWDMVNQTVLASLGGHTHRVCWASIQPINNQQFVTCSLDYSLKVWDMEAVLSGQVPAVGGLHYSILSGSRDGQYYASCQGWSTACSLHRVEGDEALAQGPNHPGFIVGATFSQDSTVFVSIDAGHRGDYSANAVYNAQVKAMDLRDSSMKDLESRGACAVACSKEHVIFGTADTRLDLFSLNSWQKVHSWQFTQDGSAIDTEEKCVLGLSCNTHKGHVAVAAGRLAKIWQISNAPDTLPFMGELGPHDDLLRGITYSPDGGHLATATNTGALCIWDATTLQKLHTLEGHTSMMKDLQYSPEGDYLASVSVEMSLRVWDVKNGYSLKTVWYGPTNVMAFVKKNVLILGEATGNKRRIEFDA